MQILSTTREVIEALGRPSAVAARFGVTQQVVTNWRMRNRFPLKTYGEITSALAEVDASAPKALWGIPDNLVVSIAKPTPQNGVV